MGRKKKHKHPRHSVQMKLVHAARTAEEKLIIDRKVSKSQIEAHENMSEPTKRKRFKKHSKSSLRFFRTRKGKKHKMKLANAMTGRTNSAELIKKMSIGMKNFMASLTAQDRRELYGTGIDEFTERDVPRINDYSGVITEAQMEELHA